MSTRIPARYRHVITDLRSRLAGGERMLFDLLCLSAVLGRALPDDDINLHALKGRLDPRPKLARGFRRILREGEHLGLGEWRAAGRRLEGRLVRALAARNLSAPDETGQFDPLRSLLSYAPSILALECGVPTEPVQRIAWTTVTRLFAAVHASSVARVPLPWIDKRRLRRLVLEARRESRDDGDASGATPGLSGRRLAVDPRLARAVGRALGERLEPQYIARYVFYAKAGDYFWPHTDSPLVHVNVFVCLEHQVPEGCTPSAFVAYRPDGSAQRFELMPGNAIAAHTQGVVHAREPLADGERVTLLAIALQPASRTRPTS